MLERTIAYIGDFDFRNQNVQAHLVKNNAKLFNLLGYKVYFIGTNRNCKILEDLNKLHNPCFLQENYLELPHSLNIKGIFYLKKIEKIIFEYLEKISSETELKFVITYSAPTYALILKKIALWCSKKNIPYIVNCADIPVFESQSIVRRVVMRLNWNYLHRINKQYANGVIAVSKYIESFYRKDKRKTVVIPPLFDESYSYYDADFEGNDIPVFLYAGTPFVLSSHKVNTKGMKDRLDKIIDLMLELENKNILFCFDVVGITKEDYCRCVPRHKNLLTFSKQINFFGRQTHEFTLKKIASSDYMINIRDVNLMTLAGMSTKVVESVSLGTPVVMNEIGDTFNYLELGTSGIKLMQNFEKNIQILSKLCEKSTKERLRNKINIKTKTPFAVENFAENMRRFLDSI